MSIHPQPIDRAALPMDTAALARFLIGKLVVRAFPDTLATARIVETEAYLTGDEASHGFRGPTPRNKVMFGPPGFAYVYLAYGVSFMLNVSSAEAGIGEAALIRAAEPVAGIEAMRRRRGDVPTRDLLRGPGRLAKALDIDRSLDGIRLVRRWLTLACLRRGSVRRHRRQRANWNNQGCDAASPLLLERKQVCKRPGVLERRPL